jgi:uncharacterized OB-fold protein
MPPTSICSKCLSTDLEWVPLTPRGTVVSFSEIFVSNKELQPITPYVVSIVETEGEGVRLAGIIKNTHASEVRIGSLVSIVVNERESGKIKPPSYIFSLIQRDSSAKELEP